MKKNKSATGNKSATTSHCLLIRLYSMGASFLTGPACRNNCHMCAVGNNIKHMCNRAAHQSPSANACLSGPTAWEHPFSQRPACRGQWPNICCWCKNGLTNLLQKANQTPPATACSSGSTVWVHPFSQGFACRNKCQMCAVVQKQALTNVKQEKIANSTSQCLFNSLWWLGKLFVH